jgi:hypothetical protein
MSAITGEGLTCASINDNFQRETGRIALGTHRLGLYKDPYLRFVTQSAFPDNMGAVVTNTIAQRTVATGSGWTDIGITGGVEVCSSTQSSVTNSCLAPVKKVGYAFDQKTFKLRHQAIESDWICLEDVRTSAFPIDDVNNYIKILADNVNKEWIERYDNDYYEAVTKVAAEPGLSESTSSGGFNTANGTSGSVSAPTSILTVGVLRELYDRLYQNNAGDDGDAVTDDGSPVFNVFAERATIENLIKLNDDVRQDIRWSDRVNDLLGANGSSLLPRKAYAGYVFHSRPFPKRFNDGPNGTFVEVAPYVTTGATKGTKAIINPAYKAAKYTSTVIFHPKAVEWLVPNPNLKVGKLVYDAQNYRGDFRWVNEWDYACNPDKNSGYWRAKMACAAKQVFPEFGFYILHLRCTLAGDLMACPDNSGYGYLV